MMKIGRTLTEIVSFSFTIGTTPIDKSSLNVLTALRYLVRYVPMKNDDTIQIRGFTFLANKRQKPTSEISPLVKRI